MSKISIKGKIKSESGESLAETLVALLIVVLAMTMLAGALVSSAKVNYAADQVINIGNPEDEKAVTTPAVVQATIKYKKQDGIDSTQNVDVTMYSATKSDGTIVYSYYTVESASTSTPTPTPTPTP